MRDTAPCRWQRWRVALVEGPVASPAERFARRPLTASPTDHRTDADGAGEDPGAGDIRHDLVARIRREIEAGTYETEEKWQAAEELLLRRVEQGR
jgi:hypothetical protein